MAVVIEVESKEMKSSNKVDTKNNPTIIELQEVHEIDQASSDDEAIDTELVEEAIDKLTQKDVSEVNDSMEPVIEIIETSSENERDNLTKSEEAKVEEMLKHHNEEVDGDNKEDLVNTAKDVLGKFKEYISSKSFDKKCEEKAEKYDVDKSLIKNTFISNVLGTIANALNLTINTVGNIIVSAIGFINMLISSAVDFSTSVLHKIVNVVTLNCGNC